MSLLAATCTVLVVFSLMVCTAQQHFRHQVQLDKYGNFVMKWNPDKDHVEIQVEVRTQGYVGIGFSPSGGMRGADIILGWVDDDGQPYLSDRHGTGDKTPVVDASQDVTLMSGRRNATHTTLRFSRPWVTCDDLHDLPITSSTMRVIWAYDDAASPGRRDDVARLPYHDHRGVASLYVAGDERVNLHDDDHVRTWDVLAPNVSLPNDVDTLYWCKLYKAPRLDRKHHFIGYEPLIAAHATHFVHHMLLYECHAPDADSSHYFEQWVDKLGTQCYAANMPDSWNGCNVPIIVWAVGAKGFSLPPEAGFPLGEEHNGATYFMLEIHYDNPRMAQDVVDSSGVRLFYTPRLRTYDAGVVQFGHSVEPFHIVPPLTMWNTTAHCHSECTRLSLPASGIHIFSGALHAHLLGSGLKLQHIRDGRELPPVLQDDHYDFNYQQERVLPQPRTVLPGDHLIVTCTYDATNKRTTTYGGFKTTNEMCLVFASYYPRQRLTECCSRPDIAMLLDTLGVTNMLNNEAVLSAFQLTSFNISTVDKERDAKRIDVMRNSSHAGETYSDLELSNYMRGMIISEPQELSGKSLLDFLNDGSLWQRESVVRLLQERLTSGQYEPYCTFHGRGMPKGMPKKAKYPHYIPYERPEEPCTPAGQGASRSGAPHGHAPSLLSDKVAFGSPITFHQDTAFHDSSTNRQHPYVYDLPASDDADSNTVNEHLSYQAGPSEADKHLLSSNAAHPHARDSPSKNHELFYNINTEPSHESGLEAKFSPVPPLINNFDVTRAVTQRDPALQAEAEATAGRPHFRTAEQSVATTCSLYSLVAVLNLILLAF